jgi:hypothetical protein
MEAGVSIILAMPKSASVNLKFNTGYVINFTPPLLLNLLSGCYLNYRVCAERIKGVFGDGEGKTVKIKS